MNPSMGGGGVHHHRGGFLSPKLGVFGGGCLRMWFFSTLLPLARGFHRVPWQVSLNPCCSLSTLLMGCRLPVVLYNILARFFWNKCVHAVTSIEDNSGLRGGWLA